MQGYLPSNVRIQHRPLISVCCICKRQRTSIDTWEPLDSEENENLTHGYCPDCIREYFPRVVTKRGYENQLYS